MLVVLSIAYCMTLAYCSVLEIIVIEVYTMGVRRDIIWIK